MEDGRKIEGRLTADTLRGVTAKLTVGDCDLYLKTAWLDGRIVRIDLTLSRGGSGVAQDAYYLARSWVEDSCRMASKLLERGADIEEVVAMWKGVEGYPSGACVQLQQLVKGPLHAIAVLIENRHDRWRNQIDVLTRRDAERKIRESQEAVEG